MPHEVALAKEYIRLNDDKATLKEMLSEVVKKQDEVQEEMLDQMSISGLDSLRVDGYTVYRSRKLAARCADREAALPVIEGWVPELVRPQFNLNSLSAYLRERYKERGDENIDRFIESLPEDVTNVIDVRHWFAISARKS